jgi:hypothetical protein
MKLWKLIQKEKKDKKQIEGKLNDGKCGYCIDGLIIKSIEPDIYIEDKAYNPIEDFVYRHSDKFYISGDFTNTTDIPTLISELKNRYERTGKINLQILYFINDYSIEQEKPFTFNDFQKLFKEMDVEI